MELETETNSIGMRLVKIPAGTFLMGQPGGTAGETPVHPVRITKPFLIASTPVTNAQWELFKPEAKETRGDWGISEEDDSAVIFVSWHDAVAFCEWLSSKEGKPYRLPTEAEWEMACRAGTTTDYWTGDVLPKEHRRDNPDDRGGGSKIVLDDTDDDPLLVGRAPANPWGLHDMHGVVEEWCLDWHGPYENPPTFPIAPHRTFKETVQKPSTEEEARDEKGVGPNAIDPVGRVPGHHGAWKVTRGGSYEVLAKDLRSASRLAQHPTSRSRFIGFRVVQAPAVATEPLPAGLPPACMLNVNQAKYDWGDAGRGDDPLWIPPVPYINPPPTARNAREFGLYPHNHCPAITWCDNGDLLAAWFSCVNEHDRDTFVILASRLVPGARDWSPPSLFYRCPGRNMTGTALLNAGDGRLFHFNGNDEATSWNSLIMTLRESTDHGATWSDPRNIGGPHGYRNQVIAGPIKTSDGKFVQLCDATPSESGGSAVWISDDGGKTWKDTGAGAKWPTFKQGGTGAWIAGIHSGIEEIKTSNGGTGFLAIGRDNNIDGMSPQSVSTDGGQTWEYSASPFPPISWGQRGVLLRLQHSEGAPLAFFSFSNPRRAPGEEKDTDGIDIVDSSGATRRVYGLFSAISFDEGRSWSHEKLISDGSGAILPCMDYRVTFIMDNTRAEPSGYMAATQTPDGIIHLISSSLHYRFNLAWLKMPMGPA